MSARAEEELLPGREADEHRAQIINLVNRIADRWIHPSGAWTSGNRNAWYTGLVDLDPGSAGRTFAVLARSEAKLPDIVDFRAAYKRQHTPYLDPTEQCAACGGNGWVESEPLRPTPPPNRPTHYPAWHPKAGQELPPYEISQVRPCTECPDGDRAREQLARWDQLTTKTTKRR